MSMFGRHSGSATTADSAIEGLVFAGRDLAFVAKRTLHFVTRKTRAGSAAQYMYEMGNQSLFFLCVVMGFVGMILVYQGGLQLQRIFPEMSQLGGSYTELLIKDLAPTVCSLMLATRVGAGIAAEIGSMVVTEQVDALRMCAADPIDYLIRPRFVASVVMTPILVIVAATVAYFAGMATASAFFEVSASTFTNLSLIDKGDIIVGLSKCLAYGAAIPLVSGYCGLTCYGGSEGVGQATTRAVVSSCLWVIVLDFALSAAGYLIFD